MAEKKPSFGPRTMKSLGDEKAVDKTERIRSTLYLSKSNYKRFQALCKRRGRTTSEVIDDMIADVLDEFDK